MAKFNVPRKILGVYGYALLAVCMRNPPSVDTALISRPWDQQLDSFLVQRTVKWFKFGPTFRYY